MNLEKSNALRMPLRLHEQQIIVLCFALLCVSVESTSPPYELEHPEALPLGTGDDGCVARSDVELVDNCCRDRMGCKERFLELEPLDKSSVVDLRLKMGRHDVKVHKELSVSIYVILPGCQ